MPRNSGGNFVTFDWLCENGLVDEDGELRYDKGGFRSLTLEEIRMHSEEYTLYGKAWNDLVIICTNSQKTENNVFW